MHAIEFLDAVQQHAGAPVVVLVGDERFLKHEAAAALRHIVLADRDDELCRTCFDGAAASLADVLDELATLPLLGGRRLVEVDDADDFITRHRQRLEEYVEAPSRHATLVLLVKTWPGNTRLARAVVARGVAVECRPLAPRQVPAWAVRRARFVAKKKLEPAAADLLVELVGNDLGTLASELEKLAGYVGDAPNISADDVQALVGGWTVKTRWEMLDAAAEGRTADSLAMLDRLLVAGEAPVALLGVIAWQFRLLAQAARLVERGVPAATALIQAGVKPFAMERARSQLARLGRARAARLFDWLIEADLGLKGDSTLPPRIVLERLLVQVASEIT